MKKSSTNDKRNLNLDYLLKYIVSPETQTSGSATASTITDLLLSIEAFNIHRKLKQIQNIYQSP